MTSADDILGQLGDEYPAWWVDLLGEHNHVGGSESTRWLLERSGLQPGRRMLDVGCFVGAAARMAALQTGAAAVALDVNNGFLAAGRQLPGGERVYWVTGVANRLPFHDGTFQSVWSLDSAAPLRELTRVASTAASLCLCCEAPSDGRGGLDAFLDEWAALGWTLGAHRPLTLEALQTWRRAESELVRRRPHFEHRYGTRSYLAQLDHVARLVVGYERGGQGHGLFVLTRDGAD